jgi:hypothetical protein
LFIWALSPQGYPITIDVPVIDQILATYKRVHFLGTLPKRDHTDARWAFYAEATGDNPPVVINIVAGFSSIEQFNSAYTTAVDAVNWYICANKQQQRHNDCGRREI